MTPTPNHLDDSAVLLELLDSTPVVDGTPSDLLATDGEARELTLRWGGTGSKAEAGHVREVRARLQAVVRGAAPASTLTELLDGASLVPDVGDQGVHWRLDAPDNRRLAVRTVLAWGELQERMPGRLRPCANPECQLFLLDRSRANAARWCSMATCGNRMKARRHYRRARPVG